MITPQEAISYFNFQDKPSDLVHLDTPIPVIDLGIVLNNLVKAQSHFDKLGITFRPHIKTHKMIPLAKIQLRLGACGITVQKLGEAEVMAEAGIQDIMVAYNIIGQRKLERLVKLARKAHLTLVADNEFCVNQLNSAAAANNLTLDLLIECDTGDKRNGLGHALQVLKLARTIVSSSNLRFKGLMTYPPSGKRKQVTSILSDFRSALTENGITVEIISSGGTTDLYSNEGLEVITEYRTGTYVFYDRMTLQNGCCTLRDCAVRVLATIVSKPTNDRLILDAGSKSLTSDLVGLDGYGVDPQTHLRISKLTEEHGQMDLVDAEKNYKIGDQIQILPNHVCPVINLFDHVAIKLDGEILGMVKVSARGRVS